MGTPLIVKLLAAQPEDELRALLTRAHEEQQRISVEIDQIQEALEQKNPTRTRPRRGEGGTRQRVLEAVTEAPRAITPAEIITILEAEGPTPSGGAIYNQLGRLLKDGEIVKVGDGLYELASPEASLDWLASHGRPPTATNGASFPPTRSAEGDEAGRNRFQS